MNLQECFDTGLLRKEKPDEKKALNSLETAETYIVKAHHTLKSRDFDLTIFCAYTSMFHASRALLFKNGIKERSHVCLIEYVRQNYPELFDDMNLLDTYRKSRHTAIYALDFIITEEQAKEAIKDAKQMLEKIRKYFFPKKNKS